MKIEENAQKINHIDVLNNNYLPDCDIEETAQSNTAKFSISSYIFFINVFMINPQKTQSISNHLNNYVGKNPRNISCVSFPGFNCQ